MLNNGHKCTEVIIIMEESNKIKRKIFIEETIGTRKYFSYRADLMLYKIVICILIFTVIYQLTFQGLFSFIISIQVFLIFTLVNKLNLDRKEKEGKIKLILKTKKEYFKKKINDIEMDGLENLIQFFFLRQKYNNYKKIEEHLFSTELEGVEYYIKIFKSFNEIEVDRLDIKNFIILLSKNNIKNGVVVTNYKINDEAKEFLKKLNNKMKINIIDVDELFDLTLKFELLPENKYFYNKILNEKESKKDVNIIKNNIFSPKKIIIYLLAAVLFYISSKVMTYNMLPLYISFYFIILTSICALYNIYKNINNKKENKS